MRVKFRKGLQRKFLERIILDLRCPSLRSIRERGFEIPYSTLKSYYQEKRLLPKGFFDDLCYLAKINPISLKFTLVEDNWGKVKGGKKSYRR